MKPEQKVDWVPLLALLVSVISLGWQIVDKYQSKQDSLKVHFNIHRDDSMVVSVTNTGSHSAFIEKPYLHIITENGKGYGFFFDDKNEKAALLSQGNKIKYTLKKLSERELSLFIAPQRIREMYVAVDSAKQEVKRIDLKTKKGKARLRRYFEVDQAAYESKLDMKKIYEKFDFLSTTTNFITEKNSDFYIGRE